MKGEPAIWSVLMSVTGVGFVLVATALVLYSTRPLGEAGDALEAMVAAEAAPGDDAGAADAAAAAEGLADAAADAAADEDAGDEGEDDGAVAAGSAKPTPKKPSKGKYRPKTRRKW